MIRPVPESPKSAELRIMVFSRILDMPLGRGDWEVRRKEGEEEERKRMKGRLTIASFTEWIPEAV